MSGPPAGIGADRHASDDFTHRGGPRQLLADDEAVARLVDVEEAQLDRIHAEGLGELVHLGLVGKADLNGSEAPHCAARGVVRAHGGRLDEGVRDVVRAVGKAGGVERHGRRGRQVSAPVEDDSRLDTHEMASRVGRVPVPHAGRMPMHMAVERLLARVDDLDGAPGGESEQAQLHLHAQVLAGSEGAADAGEVDTHLVVGEVEAGGDLILVDVQPLRGDVQVDACRPRTALPGRTPDP